MKELDDSLNPIGPGKRMNPLTEKALNDLSSDAKNLSIIR